MTTQRKIVNDLLLFLWWGRLQNRGSRFHIPQYTRDSLENHDYETAAQSANAQFETVCHLGSTGSANTDLILC